jgi:hypothetical protein
LLIAALAILSTVVLPPDDFEEELDERVLADFAIAYFSLCRGERHFNAVTVPSRRPSARIMQM